MSTSLRALFALSVALIAPASAAAAPTITITTPASGAVYAATPAVNANYSCAPDTGTLAPVTQCDATIDANPAIVANGSPLDMTGGSHTLTVTANDGTGPVTKSASYSVDVTAPTISSSLDAPSPFAINSLHSLTYGCADANGCTISAAVTDPFGFGPTPLGASVVGIPTNADGTWKIALTATDSVGNSATSSLSYVVDGIPPALTASLSTAGPFRGGSAAPTLSVGCTDTSGCTTDAILTNPNGGTLDLGNGSLLTLSTALQGTYSVTATAVDGVGLTATPQTFTYVVDATPPTITITTPTASANYLRAQAVNAAFSCSDTGGALPPLTCTGQILDGSNAVVGTISSGAPLPTTTDGTFTLRVSASDSVGNTSTASSSFIVDGTPPVVTITTPAAGTAYQVGQAVNASFACSDPGPAALVDCVGTVANGAALDTATAGTKTLTVTAHDAAGNTTTVSRDYIVDGTPPAIALTTPAQGSVFAKGEVVNAAYSCVDSGGAGLASCTGTVPNGQPIDTTAGAHTFTVTAIDKAGNTTTVTHSYRASICSRTGAHAVSCELWARTGTVDLPGAPNLPTKTFSDHGAAPAVTQVGGPTLDALAGDTVSVTLHNDLSEPIALAVPQQPMAPATTKIAAGGQTTYSFVARLGTSIYEAGSASTVLALDENVAKQVAQGLYGALVVRPAADSRQAYGTAATAYDEEALVVLSEIDPALNNDPAAFDMTTFAPKYALINGRPYDGTAAGTLPIVSAPGHDTLLRVVNAGVHDHPIGLLGLRESVVGESSLALRYPRSAIAMTVAPGGTADALVHLPSAPSAAGHYALYDTGLRLVNGGQAGFGGMLTTIDATGTWATTCAGPVTSRVQAPDTTTGASDLAFSAYVTPCAAAPASTVTAAEFFIDSVGTDGTGTAIALGPNPLAGGVTQARLLALAEGRHTIYVHGRDSTGAWGQVSSDTFVIARIGPTVGSIVLNPNPTNLDPATIHLAATADATAHAGRTVAAAEYFVDPAGAPTPGTGTALALGGNAAIAALDGDVPLAGLTAGMHTIVVEAKDDLGNWGATSSFNFVVDTAGPVVTNVAVAPSPNNGTLDQPGHPGVVWVTATVTDGGPYPSAIKTAEGFIDPAGTPTAHNGWQLIPVDGQFDQSVEQVYAAIPLEVIVKLTDGSHVFAIRGQDAAGNWGTLATGTLQIEKTGPAITAAALAPATQRRGGSVQLTATATDPSGVDQFEYFLDEGPATSVTVAGTLGSPRSISQTIGIPRDATPGQHFVFVRAHDGAGNWGPWTRLALTVDNRRPLGEPAVTDPATGGVTASNTGANAGARIAIQALGQARLVSVTTLGSNAVRARFVFAPHGISFRGTKTIVTGRDAAGRTVLSILVSGNAKHGYRLRAASGRKRSAWLVLTNRRIVLEATLRPGMNPILTRAH